MSSNYTDVLVCASVHLPRNFRGFFSPSYIYIDYISCVVRPVAPSRGRFHSDVAVTLRGESTYEVFVDFDYFVCKRLGLDRGVSVTCVSSHTCGKQLLHYHS